MGRAAARLGAVDERPVDGAWLTRYLNLLGVEREPPGPEALARLVRAQGELNVFENVTAILRRARVPRGPVPAVDPEALLAALAAGSGGGVCFELAPLFRRLLAGLGYRVTPILAQISFPGSHHATVVDLDGVRYLVDAGSGSPLWRPFPLHETVELYHAGLGFRFRPERPEAAAGRDSPDSRDSPVSPAGGDGADPPTGHLQERLIDGAWEVHCRYDLRPASGAAREAAYQRHQVAGQTWVVGNLTLVRCTPEAVHRLRDDELVTYTATGKRVERLEGDAAFRRAAGEVFGLPALPVTEALAVLAAIRERPAPV
jgi:arylamine N-acetyltransferase